MYISPERAVMVLQLLLEGNSIRSTERITGIDQNTIMSLLVKAGERCQRIMDEKLVNLDVRDVEVDEIWGYVGKKEGHRGLRSGIRRDWRCLLLRSDGAQYQAGTRSLLRQAQRAFN